MPMAFNAICGVCVLSHTILADYRTIYLQFGWFVTRNDVTSESVRLFLRDLSECDVHAPMRRHSSTETKVCDDRSDLDLEQCLPFNFGT